MSGITGIYLAAQPSTTITADQAKVLQIEVERAPDLSGSPDTGNAVSLMILDPGDRAIVDPRPQDGSIWWYRTRYIGPGYAAGTWTSWVGAAALTLPEPLPPLGSDTEVVPVVRGGTEITDYLAAGAIPVSSSATTMAALPVAATGVLKSAGIATTPVWGTITDAEISGTISASKVAPYASPGRILTTVAGPATAWSDPDFVLPVRAVYQTDLTELMQWQGDPEGGSAPVATMRYNTTSDRWEFDVLEKNGIGGNEALSVEIHALTATKGRWDFASGQLYSNGSPVESSGELDAALAVFNVVRYGADPTGTSDSRSAIQDAWDAMVAAGGGKLYFPFGNYRVDSPGLDWSDGGDWFVIEGVGARLVANGTFTGPLVTLGDPTGTTRTNYLEWRGLKLYGGTATGITAGLRVQEIFNCSFFDLLVQDMPDYGVFLAEKGYNNRFWGCTIWLSGGTGVFDDTTGSVGYTPMWWYGCRFEGNGKHGVDIGTDQSNFIGCTFQSNATVSASYYDAYCRDKVSNFIACQFEHFDVTSAADERVMLRTESGATVGIQNCTFSGNIIAPNTFGHTGLQFDSKVHVSGNCRFRAMKLGWQAVSANSQGTFTGTVYTQNNTNYDDAAMTSGYVRTGPQTAPLFRTNDFVVDDGTTFRALNTTGHRFGDFVWQNAVATFAGANISIIVADDNTNATTKGSRIGALPYNSDTENPAIITYTVNDATTNQVNIGGGTAAGQAATNVRLWTAATTNTSPGTARWEVQPTGDLVPFLTTTYDLGNSTHRVAEYWGQSLNVSATATINTLVLTVALDETYGGTGQTTYTTGQILYASAADTLATRSIGNAGDVLTVSGGLPVWAAPTLAASSVTPGTFADGVWQFGATSAGANLTLRWDESAAGLTIRREQDSVDPGAHALRLRNAADSGDIFTVDWAGNVVATSISGIAAGSLSLAAGFTVVGKSTTGAGSAGEIAAAADQVLRRSGTGDLLFGTLVTNHLGANVVTFAKLVQAGAAGLSVVGRSTNSAGDFAEIAAGTDGHVLRRSGTALGFGTLANGAFADNTIAHARLANITQDQVLGRTAAGSGAVSAINTSALTGLAAGGVTSGTFADARIAQSNVTQHQAALSIAESQIPDGALLARVADSETVTGLWTFDRDPSAPFAVTSGSAVVANLDADKLDGIEASGFLNLAPSGAQTVQAPAQGAQTAYQVVLAAAAATGGGTLIDSPGLKLRGEYWTGSASAEESWTIYNDVTGTTPSSRLAFENGTAGRVYINSNGVFEFFAGDSVFASFTGYAFAANYDFQFRRAQGTRASPTAVGGTTTLGSLSFAGMHTAPSSYASQARIYGITSQSWTGSNRGTEVYVETTENNTSTRTARWGWLHAGHYAPVADQTYDVGTTSLRARTIYTDNVRLGTTTEPGLLYWQTEYDNGTITTSFTVDWTRGNVQRVKAGNGSSATVTFTAPGGAAVLILRVLADGTQRTFAWPSTVKWTAGSAPTMPTTNNSWVLCWFYFDGTNYTGVGYAAVGP